VAVMGVNIDIDYNVLSHYLGLGDIHIPTLGIQGVGEMGGDSALIKNLPAYIKIQTKTRSRWVSQDYNLCFPIGFPKLSVEYPPSEVPHRMGYVPTGGRCTPRVSSKAKRGSPGNADPHPHQQPTGATPFVRHITRTNPVH